MPGFDPRAWNLFGALALALPACGDVPADADEPAADEGDPDDDDDDDDWDDDYESCGDEAEDDTGLRCYPPDYDDDEDYEDYGCRTHAECGVGNICVNSDCEPGESMPECTDAMSFGGGIPLPPESEGAIILTAVEADGDSGAELLVQDQIGLRLIDTVAGTVHGLNVAVYPQPYLALGAAFDSTNPEDIILQDPTNGSLWRLPNDGAGTFGEPQYVGDADVHARPLVADLDGDGNLDLYAGGVRWSGDGVGGLSAPLALPGLHVFGPVVRFAADLDPADELLGMHADALVLSSLDLEAGVEPLEAAYRGQMLDLVAHDLDEDGLEDVARLMRGGDLSVLNWFAGDQLVSQARDLGLPERHRSLVAVDPDADGEFELVGWSPYGDEVVVYRHFASSAPCYSRTGILATGVATADFDGDGRDELAITTDGVTRLYGAD